MYKGVSWEFWDGPCAFRNLGKPISWGSNRVEKLHRGEQDKNMSVRKSLESETTPTGTLFVRSSTTPVTARCMYELGQEIGLLPSPFTAVDPERAS
jgi:hypothetical protein